MHGMSRTAEIALKYLGLTLLFYPLGVLCHELVGHGLVGVLCGGRIVEVEMLGFRVWPEFQCAGWSGRYGACNVVGVTTPTGEAMVSLGGAMSTYCVAVIATLLLWCRRWDSFWRPILITLSLWWIDLFTYMLPSWGLPRSVLWGQRTYSEPYEAAISLGMPGAWFQSFVIAGCMVIFVILMIRVLRDAEQAQEQESAPSS